MRFECTCVLCACFACVFINDNITSSSTTSSSMSVEKKKKAVKRHLSSINEDGGVIMSGLLVKKGKRSYLSSARHCALTNDCFIYSSGEVRRIPVLNMQVSVARESFTLVDCSDESFTFRCLGKTKADREREVQQWTQSIAKARDGQKLVRKDVLKQGKTRDAVLVTTWLTERCLVTAEPFKTGATLILLQSVAEILPVPLEPALIMHTKAGKSLRLIMSTEKTQRVWLELIVENIRRAKLNASSSSAELFSDNNMPKDIEAEMRYDALVKSMRAAVQVFYDRFAPAKVSGAERNEHWVFVSSFWHRLLCRVKKMGNVCVHRHRSTPLTLLCDMPRLSMWTNSWNNTTGVKSSCLQSTSAHILCSR